MTRLPGHKLGKSEKIFTILFGSPNQRKPRRIDFESSADAKINTSTPRHSEITTNKHDLCYTYVRFLARLNDDLGFMPSALFAFGSTRGGGSFIPDRLRQSVRPSLSSTRSNH